MEEMDTSDTAQQPDARGTKRAKKPLSDANNNSASTPVASTSQGAGDASSAKKRKTPTSGTKTPTSGTKTTTSGTKTPTSGKRQRNMTAKQVHELLKKLGVEKPESCSNCLKAAISTRVLVLETEDDLDQVLLSGRIDDYGYECEHMHHVRVRDVLYQPDYGGHDYEEGSEDATAKCKELNEDGEECNQGMYITGICRGQPSFDSGKFHYHCEKCTKRKNPFGVCVGDYRQAHCDECGWHYFAGCSVSSGCNNRRCPAFRRDGYGESDDEGASDCCVM